MSSRSRNNDGFTLIEVLVSMAIMVFIAFGIYQAVTETYHLRDVLSTEGDFYNSIRLAMNIIQRDVSLIYSPVNIIPAKNAATNPNQPPVPPGFPGQPAAPVDPSLQQGDLAQESTYWGPALHKTGIRPSRFIGTPDKMSFVATSHLRVYRDSPESEFAKVEYSLMTDDEDPNAKMLVKTESTNVWEEEERKDTTIRSFRLLHGIKTFKYVYYFKKDNDLKANNTWDSNQEATKNQYPDMIEVNIEVSGPEKLEYVGQYRFRPEFPLNGLDPST